MRLFALILLVVPLSSLAQFQGIYVKFESTQRKKSSIATVYIYGQKNIILQTLTVPTNNFFSIRLYQSSPVYIAIGDAQNPPALAYKTAGFICGDSIIVNIDNGYSKIINRVYSEYEQNYFFYLQEYFNKNKFNISVRNWKDLHQSFELEKEFIEESFAQRRISDSFYYSLILDLPYKVNNYILRAPFIYTEVVTDSLIACRWYKDSLINSPSYLEYVIGYIHYFKLPKLKNGPERDSAFFNYVYINTSGSLREQLLYDRLLIPSDLNSEYLKEFETFKKIAPIDLIKSIEEKIEDDKRNRINRQ